MSTIHEIERTKGRGTINNDVYEGYMVDVVVDKEEECSLEKSKRLKVKRLSAVVNEEEEEDTCEIDCAVEEQHSVYATSVKRKSSRFKLQMKHVFVGSSNGVQKSSVPRKLRSAMKKRSRESPSPPFPDSKKLNHATSGVELIKRNPLKRKKQEPAHLSSKEYICCPITKDEEEVAATLSTFAGMFPENDSSRNKCTFPSIEAAESTPSITAVKEDLEANCIPKTEESCSPFNLVKLAGGNAGTNHFDSPTDHGVLNLSSSLVQSKDVVSSVTHSTEQTMLLKHEDQTQSCDLATRSPVTSEFCHEIREARRPIQLASLLDGKVEVALESTAIKCPLDQHHNVGEPEKNGEVAALWSGLSFSVSKGSWNNSPSRYSAVKVPASLDCDLRPVSFQSSTSTIKFSKVKTDKREGKRCAAHVCICWLIQEMKTPVNKEGSQLQLNQIRTPHLLKQNPVLTGDLGGTQNGLDEVFSASEKLYSTRKNSNKPRSSIFNNLMPSQHQPSNGVDCTSSTSLKQSYDFLSLSAGGSRKEVNNRTNGSGRGFGTLDQMQLHSLPSHLRHPPLIPVSIRQTVYTSSAHTDQLSAAQVQQHQLPPYLSVGMTGPYANSSAMTELHQQQLWPAQYGTQGAYTVMAQYLSSQSGQQRRQFMQATRQSSSLLESNSTWP